MTGPQYPEQPPVERQPGYPPSQPGQYQPAQYQQPQNQPMQYQPAQNQPAYAQNPYGPTGAMAGYTPGGVGRINPGLRVGVVGSVLTLIGAVLLIVSFTALDWLSADGASIKFSDLHNAFSGAHLAQPADAYFGWLAWTLLVVAVLVALLANAPMGLSVALRPLGLILGLVGAGLTFWALKFNSETDYSDVLKHTSVGFWFAVVGFVLAAVGAISGPRHVRA
jgi:hypothetical protein